jgi:hypothetical protein
MAELYPLPNVISPFAPRISPPNTGSPARAERVEQRQNPPPPPPTNSARGTVVDVQA